VKGRVVGTREDGRDGIEASQRDAGCFREIEVSTCESLGGVLKS
jgi:hypothetical protein